MQMSEHSLKIYTTGEGPTLLFIHGLGSSRRCWDLAVNALRREFHCCTLDLYGHGSNRTIPDSITIQQTSAELGDILRTVKWKPALMVGHSLGGLVAVQLALQQPDCADQLVLVDTPTRQVQLGFLKKMVLSTLRKNFRQAVTKQYTRMIRDKDLRQELTCAALTTDQAAYLKYMESLLNMDLTDHIKDIQIPVHVWMTRSLAPDKPTLRKVLKQYGYSHLPEEHRHHTPDAGHFVMLEQPEAFVQELKQIVNQHDHSQSGVNGSD
jgi:pimeloyl-ACP methyl ester carboxylesterase